MFYRLGILLNWIGILAAIISLLFLIDDRVHSDRAMAIVFIVMAVVFYATGRAGRFLLSGH